MERLLTTTKLGYPPSGHVLRYVRLAFDTTTPGHTEGLMPAFDDLCDAGGTIRLGAIALLTDFAAGSTAIRTVSPDWTVTHDMALHMVRPAPPEGELEAACEVTRAGKNSVTSETTIISPAVGEVARVFVTFTRIPRRDDTPVEPRLTRINLAEPDVERPRVPLDEAVGFRLETGPSSDSTGTSRYIEFDHTPFIVNSLGAIQGGVIALALERAASWAGEGSMGPGVRTTDLHLHYLALGKKGPFQARTEVFRADERAVVSRLALHDTGDDDRLLALGVGTATRIEP
ncbi:MAG: PaaI family thioesterase [Actinomycetia bacterium]|nr:PaaI family thioesterase [Actinomycetes bacterium]MCP4227735.1 PaaI family thioesterase [Actinomycetes bacterium]MCP5034855.1 PaaI family thioesterase [Actinomycetes bacterium]